MKYHVCERDYLWNSRKFACEIKRYLKSIAQDLLIIYDEVIDAVVKSHNDLTKATPINFNEKKTASKIENFFILLAFILTLFL